MRILHTSDWHLGRSFHGLHLLEDQAVVLAQILQIAKDSKVDVVVVAGDIYDRAGPPTDAVGLLNATLEELILNLHLPVILIAGNHDNPDRLNFGQALFAQKQLYIYGTVMANATPVALEDKYGSVYFAPLTYCEPLTATELSGEKQPNHDAALAWQIKQMLAQIPADARKIAVAHAFVAGAMPTPDSERPLAVGGTTTVELKNFEPFNYTALGHLHATQNCSPIVRYSGSLLKYSFAEATQKKAVHIVDLDGSGAAKVETIALTQPHDLIRLKGSFQELLAKDPADYAAAYMQLTLTDAAPILDAKHKLETVYPQILELTYERLTPAQKELSVEAAQKKKVSSHELFSTFFQAVNERKLETTEDTLLRQALTHLEDKGRRA